MPKGGARAPQPVHPPEKGKSSAMRPPYRAFVALVRAAAYSVRQPQTYQVGTAFPVPQPSTLVGSLACAAALAEGGPAGVSGDKYVEQLAKSILGMLVRATAKPVTPLASSSVTLSRVRALEESSEKVRENIEKGRRISDAMVREYYSGRLALIYVFKDVVEAPRVLSWLYLIGRIGDTESLVSLESVGEASLEPLGSEGYVDTYTPLEWVESYGEGAFSLARLCGEELCAWVVRKREDYEEHSAIYIVPLAEKGSGRERRILEASKVHVRTARDYKIWKVKGAGVEANVVLPEGERYEQSVR